ncbi:hypothetical protein LTR50_007192 [Elasticomyces elasticus]|nr:hypothetical protein LTR50_007192 [Elasticomyces elasticus]
MASILTRPSARFITGAALVGSAGALIYATRRPYVLDAAQNAPSKTLSFPKNMPFSRQITVTEVEQINHDTKRITFALPGGSNEVSGVAPGGALLTQHSPPGRFFPVFRPYTPVHDLDERGILQLVVKKYPNGLASGHLHSLQPGDELTVRGPIPSYNWKPSPSPRHLLLVAGGAGITPMFSLVQGILNNPKDQTSMQLVWGVNSTRDIVLKNELENLEERFRDRLRVTYVVSGPEAAPDAPSLGDPEKFKKGYIDKVVLQKAIDSAGDKENWGDTQGTKVFFCGPPAMQEAVAGKNGVLINDLGIAKKAVHVF